MINQILNRDFVLDQLRQIHKYLSLPAEERRRGGAVPPEAKNIVEDDRQAALAAIQTSLTQERAESSGQSPRFERRGNEPPLDDWSFFSRDAVVSNLQTVLDYYFMDGPGKSKVSLKAAPDKDRRGPGQPSFVGDASLSGYDSRPAEGRRLFDKFSVSDPEWVSSALAAGLRLFRGRHKFVDQGPVVPIADQARVVMVGDWGSGIPRAQNIGQNMRKFVLEALTTKREVHVIHLGDVYYSGWQREYEKRFLPFWPIQIGEAQRARSWSLNGNHDMYSGGFGYYDFLLKDPRFSAQGGSSFFCLENKNWKIFGLDSSWDDGGLKDPQAEWLRARMDLNKKTMLLTHHQPFSSYEAPAQSMVDKLAAVSAAAGGVKSWFWGHEHRFMLFKPFNHVQFGRLIGHGGVPVYMTHKQNDPYPGPGLFEDRRFMPGLGGLEHWAHFGFAVLDFVNGQINVQYLDEDGNHAHPDETIV